MEPKAGLDEASPARWLSPDFGGCDPLATQSDCGRPQQQHHVGPPASRATFLLGRPPRRIDRAHVHLREFASSAAVPHVHRAFRAGLMVRETTGESLRVFLLLARTYFVLNAALS